VHLVGRSQWPRDLRLRSTAARLLRSWVRIPPGVWMFVCCVLLGRVLWEELIARLEESYRLWPVVMCDQEKPRIRGGHSPRWAAEPEKIMVYYMTWYDMIWHDMIWYDMIWYDMIWYDMTWHDIWYMIWYDMILYVMIYYMIWYDIWYDRIWYDMIWHDMAWHDMTWHDMIWYDMLWYMKW
jgi:hypothetical protein